MNHTLWHKSLIIVILLFFLLCTSCEHATRKDFLNPDFATSTSPLFSVWDDYCIDGMSDECCLQDDEHKKLEPKNMISTCYCNYTSKSCYSTIEWTANGQLYQFENYLEPTFVYFDFLSAKCNKYLLEIKTFSRYFESNQKYLITE